MSANQALPLFRARPGAGFAAVLANEPRAVRAAKVERRVQVTFVTEQRDVQTPEGPVHAFRGDAIVTDEDGDSWPVHGPRFAARYAPLPPTVAGSDGAYVSAPQTVMALRMDAPFQVLLQDGLSRLSGQRGDWLVGTADGSLYVISAAAFARTYRIDGALPR
jgi:hypothetical protein